jgi:hypothetical protein
MIDGVLRRERRDEKKRHAGTIAATTPHAWRERAIFAACEDFNPGSDLKQWLRAHRVRPSASYVNWVAAACRSVAGNPGSTRTPNRDALGTNSRSSCNRLGASSAPKTALPVTFPPGRLRLAIRPNATGSAPVAKMMGMVVVAAFAVSATPLVPHCIARGAPASTTVTGASVVARARMNVRHITHKNWEV